MALRLARVALLVLVIKRIGYHLAYLLLDPFAQVTFSDGQLYELAARDLIAHPPWGSAPFYLQGLYAAFLALPLSLGASLAQALLLQLAVVAAALSCLHRATVRVWGPLAGTLSTVVLLSFFELSFYENKFLSVALGVACNMLALWALLRCVGRMRVASVLLAGATAGLCVLARPNMVLALPLSALGLAVLARAEQRSVGRALSAFALGVILVLAPMALRNQLVVGAPLIFPSHGGGVPLYIGNNPAANGRWNDAGGLLSGQVFNERVELARRVGVESADKTPLEIDRAVNAVLRRRVLEYVAEHPVRWLQLEGRKLWLMLGNHSFVRDYDMRGERELLGSVHQLGAPFGMLLGLGVLGFAVLLRRALRQRALRAVTLAALLVVGGQLIAVLAANLLVFTSAQNRVPLAPLLAFVAGPGLVALARQLTWLRARRGGSETTPHAPWSGADGGLSLPVLLLGGLLALQAFWPRLPAASQPSSVHYFNLATVEEVLGRPADAARHYGRAAERNPRQPLFQYRHARALLRAGDVAGARTVLDRISRGPALRPELAQAVTALRAELDRAPPGAPGP